MNIELKLIDSDNHPNKEKAKAFAQLRLDGVVFPPVELYKKENGHYGVRDGRHRIWSAQMIGASDIEARILVKGRFDWGVEESLRAVGIFLRHWFFEQQICFPGGVFPLSPGERNQRGIGVQLGFPQ